MALTGTSPVTIAALCGKTVYPFALAALSICNAQAEQADSVTAYGGAAPETKKGPRIWMSYDRLLDDAAIAAAARGGAAAPKPAPKAAPFTLTKEVRHALGGVFAAAVAVITKSPASTSLEAALAVAPPAETAVIRRMQSIVAGKRAALEVEPLRHDHALAENIKHALSLLVGARAGAKTQPAANAAAIRYTSAIEPAARLIVDFLKCVGWACALLAFTHGCGAAPRAWALNPKNFRTVLMVLDDTGSFLNYLSAHAGAELAALAEIAAAKLAPVNEVVGAENGAADDDADDADDADDDADDAAEEDAAENDEDAAAAPAAVPAGGKHGPAPAGGKHGTVPAGGKHGPAPAGGKHGPVVVLEYD